MTEKNDRQITFESNSSFTYSFMFLPKEKREAMYTLYSFCRQTDDIADSESPTEFRRQELNTWEDDLKKCFTNKSSNYFESVKAVAERFKIPVEYFLELIDGVRMDLYQREFKNFDDLKLYCYRVASIVGLMCIQIFGYRDPLIKQYAENLGIALQLTNIIRDVGHDAKMGRIYIPDSELKQFNVPPEDIFQQNHTQNFHELMQFQAERAENYYQLAMDCLPENERVNMLVSEIMKNIYYHLLHKIKDTGFNVLEQQMKLSKPLKIWLALKTVYQIRFAQPSTV